MRYNPKIKIFLDSSSINEVQKFKKIINISGVTTNPSIMKNEGVLNYYDHCRKMCSKIHNIPLSFEILSDNREKIIDQAIKLSNIGKNIYVKIPIVNSLGKSNLAISSARSFEQNLIIFFFVNSLFIYSDKYIFYFILL